MKVFLRPLVLVPAAAVAVLVITVGLYLFQPWKLFTDTTVNEAFPIAASALAEPNVEASSAPSPSNSSAPARATAKVVATGNFISHEHGTSGTAAIINLPDGSRVLRIENLDTSNGPDLKVWLADAPVIDGPSD